MRRVNATGKILFFHRIVAFFTLFALVHGLVFVAYTLFGTVLEYSPVAGFGLWPPGLNVVCVFQFLVASGVWYGVLMAGASSISLTARIHYFLTGFYIVIGTACLGLATAGVLVKIPAIVSGIGLRAVAGEFVSGAVQGLLVGMVTVVASCPFSLGILVLCAAATGWLLDRAGRYGIPDVIGRVRDVFPRTWLPNSEGCAPWDTRGR